MKYLAILVTAATLLLSGCATTIRSDVTVFHEWPAQLPDKSYVFDAAPPAHDTLEYRNYLGMLRGQLAQLGFTEAADPNQAKLKVAMQFSTIDIPVRVIESDPYWVGPGWSGPGWGRYGYGGPWGYGRYGGFYRPYYDPFFYGPVELRETIRHQYERHLRVTINTVEGKKLFDVTVQNTSTKAATPFVMPALLTSAFAGFPGENGVPHRVTLQLEKGGNGKVAAAQ